MRSLTITLSDELAQAVAAKVASGQFDSESAVVREGLETLLADDGATELWLRDEVVASCTEMAAEPSVGIPVDDVLSRIERRVLSKP